jgi:hypothetical protein
MVMTPRTMKKKMTAERSETRGKSSNRYPLFVSWSDEDQVFIAQLLNRSPRFWGVLGAQAPKFEQSPSFHAGMSRAIASSTFR